MASLIGSELSSSSMCHNSRMEFCQLTACQRKAMESTMAAASVTALSARTYFFNQGSSRYRHNQPRNTPIK